MALLPAQLPATKLRRLYEYWCSRCQGGALPSRRDIDPLDIPDLLPNLFLLDVIGDAEDFVFRLAGSRVEEAFSMSLRGRSLAEIHKAAGMPIPVAQPIEDRKSVVSGTSGSVRVDLGGRRIIKKKKYKTKIH